MNRRAIRLFGSLAVAIIVAGSIASPSGAAAPLASHQFSPFEAAIAAFDADVATGVAADAAGCVSIAVFVGNEVIWSKGYGWADIENRVAATAETIGRIGSISKSFTAAVTVQLAERGILDLDDPVVDYFPEIGTLAGLDVETFIERFQQAIERSRAPAPAAENEQAARRARQITEQSQRLVARYTQAFPELDPDNLDPAAVRAALEKRMKPLTFRMLASHTAGLIREPRLQGAASGPIYRWEEKILESLPATWFQTPPLTEYSYSNIGFGTLGLASSRAAGVPFMDLVADQIFTPLGMGSSTFIVNTPELAARLSVGYARRRTGEVSAEQATREHFGRGYKVPNGGIYSTVGDLAKFAAAMMGESPVQILSETSRAEALTPQPPAPGYGLGFTISESDGMKVVGHGGSVAGYNANLSFELNSKIGVAMLRTTSYNPPTGALLRQLVAAQE